MSKKINKMVHLSMFMAITIVLSYINKIVPSFPQGGTISIDIVAIFLCSYLLGVKYAMICGVGVSVLQLVLGLVTYYGPYSLFLDYFIPLSVCGIAALFKNYKIFKFDLYLGVVVAMILKFMSHYVSGAWLFGEYAPSGLNPWIYSFGYNFYYNFFTLILCLVLVPILYKKLRHIYKV